MAEQNPTDDPITDERAAHAGLLLGDAGEPDVEADLVADAGDLADRDGADTTDELANELAAEEAAMHLEEPPPYRATDSYLDDTDDTVG